MYIKTVLLLCICDEVNSSIDIIYTIQPKIMSLYKKNCQDDEQLVAP